MNTLSINIGIDDTAPLKLADDWTFAHLYITSDIVLVLRDKEAAEKLARLALECYARLLLKEQTMTKNTTS